MYGIGTISGPRFIRLEGVAGTEACGGSGGGGMRSGASPTAMLTSMSRGEGVEEVDSIMGGGMGGMVLTLDGREVGLMMGDGRDLGAVREAPRPWEPAEVRMGWMTGEGAWERGSWKLSRPRLEACSLSCANRGLSWTA
jgi:hypothetical protein